MSRLTVLILAGIFLGGLAACARFDPPATDLSALSCLMQLEAVNNLVDAQGVRDSAAVPVAGFVYLRANRNSVLMTRQLSETDDGDRTGLFARWIAQMRGLDRAARRSEMANLPAGFAISAIDVQRVEECANRMAENLAPGDFRDIAAGVFVPDDYLDFQRIAGLYPLTAFPAYFGYEGWKRDNFGSFATPPAVLRQEGIWHDYQVAPQADKDTRSSKELVALTARPGSSLSGEDEKAVRALAARFAPVFRVRTAGNSDRIGAPSLASRDALAEIDTDQPTLYYRLGRMYFAGQWHPQLVYSVWFPERPAQGMFDLLAGHLDALTWRVTLDHDGRPLLADSIHGCGCYHLFFPSTRLERISAPEDADIRETAESPAGYLTPALLSGPVLWVDATSHYLLAVTRQRDAVPADAVFRASLHPEQTLSSIALDDGSGSASLFDERGFVPGTDRLERFVLWPMGIKRPGAMRQWGHHATAFVGRRHFDEPELPGRYFKRR